MRIFTITDRGTEKKIDVGFTERFSKLPRHLAKYTLSLQTKIIGEKIGDLRVLIFGAKEPNAYKSFNLCKLQVTESGEFKLKEEFIKPNENIPIPLIFIYRKNKKGFPIADELAKVLENYYSKLAVAYAKKSKAIALNEAYKAEIKSLAKELFLEMDNKGFAIEVKGVLLDQFFAQNNLEGVCLEDAFQPNSGVSNKASNIPEKQQLAPLTDEVPISITPDLQKTCPLAIET